ncbi:hypothetical protein TorRG33x02_125750 [Trema orientale]|uniref:Uncharacterized protein n=1 Tax=Trema orientale TaxID=63057 RepID=A0A2P5F169_TREOI|nr:hypothetical protein TorRG33x02_125750 [Trema orientale]
MEISIERVPNAKEYVVSVDNGRFTITTTWAETEANARAWIQIVRKIYPSENDVAGSSLSAPNAVSTTPTA